MYACILFDYHTGHGPIVTNRQKFSKLGLVKSQALVARGVEPGIATILAGTANFGLSTNTWRSYECIINNLGKCEKKHWTQHGTTF